MNFRCRIGLHYPEAVRDERKSSIRRPGFWKCKKCTCENPAPSHKRPYLFRWYDAEPYRRLEEFERKYAKTGLNPNDPTDAPIIRLSEAIDNWKPSQ